MAERVFGARWSRVGSGSGGGAGFSPILRQVVAETTVVVSTNTPLLAFTSYRGAYDQLYAFFWNDSATEEVTIYVDPGEANSGAVAPDIERRWTIVVPVSVGAVPGHAMWPADRLVHSSYRISGETAAPSYNPASIRWKLMGVQKTG